MQKVSLMIFSAAAETEDASHGGTAGTASPSLPVMISRDTQGRRGGSALLSQNGWVYLL